ncbi:MAG: hypothetical protein IPG23_24715 [Burkholderiales bacterium]|nr:hypothetical protein [Burkholderiales bacterium]
MQFSAILTSLALCGTLVLATSTPTCAQSREPTAADATLLEMVQAFKQRDGKRLSALLPQARGHLLEPWAAYWELSARLDNASTNEIQDFLNRYKGSYQEDRLRNEWLLLLGRKRDWQAFNREYPLFRMNDDKSVRCYALLAEHFAGRGLSGRANGGRLPKHRRADGFVALRTALFAHAGPTTRPGADGALGARRSANCVVKRNAVLQVVRAHPGC